MPLARLFALLALLLTAACFPVAPQVALGPSYYVMRHLDTETGQDPPLSAEGARRAALLPAWFAGDPPAAIYVTDTRRARQTAAPLAAALAITPKIYDPADTQGLVRMVAQENGAVLVIGHSNTVPDIVAALGGTRPAPIAHDRFGDIWHISPASGSTLLLNVDGS